MNAWEVAPDVFCLGPSGRTQTNVYFVRSDAGWFLVDAGWQSDRPASSRRRVGCSGAIAPGGHPAHALPSRPRRCRAGPGAGMGSRGAHASRGAAHRHGDFEAMRASAGPLDRWVVLPSCGPWAGGGVRPCWPGPAWVRSHARSIRGARSRAAGLAVPAHAGTHTGSRGLRPASRRRPHQR